MIIQHLYNPGAINPIQRQKIRQLERKQQKYLLQRMEVKMEIGDVDIRDRLFFTVNEPIFKILP